MFRGRARHRRARTRQLTAVNAARLNRVRSRCWRSEGWCWRPWRWHRPAFAAEQDDSRRHMLLLLTGALRWRQGQHIGAMERYRQAAAADRTQRQPALPPTCSQGAPPARRAPGWTAAALEDHSATPACKLKLQGKMRLGTGPHAGVRVRDPSFREPAGCGSAAASSRKWPVQAVRRWQTGRIGLATLFVALLGIAGLAPARQSVAGDDTLAMQDPHPPAGSNARPRARWRAIRRGETVVAADARPRPLQDGQMGRGRRCRPDAPRSTAGGPAARARDPLGRVGGEEFVVVSGNQPFRAGCTVVAHRLLGGDAILRPRRSRLRVSVSIGIAQCRRDETATACLTAPMRRSIALSSARPRPRRSLKDRARARRRPSRRCGSAPPGPGPHTKILLSLILPVLAAR